MTTYLVFRSFCMYSYHQTVSGYCLTLVCYFQMINLSYSLYTITTVVKIKEASIVNLLRFILNNAILQYDYLTAFVYNSMVLLPPEATLFFHQITVLEYFVNHSNLMKLKVFVSNYSGLQNI